MLMGGFQTSDTTALGPVLKIGGNQSSHMIKVLFPDSKTHSTMEVG